MLDYVVKLTKEPWSMVKADVKALRETGFSDVAILDIVQVTGYYAYVNRLADGLGVELESIWDENQSLHKWIDYSGAGGEIRTPNIQIRESFRVGKQGHTATNKDNNINIIKVLHYCLIPTIQPDFVS